MYGKDTGPGCCDGVAAAVGWLFPGSRAGRLISGRLVVQFPSAPVCIPNIIGQGRKPVLHLRCIHWSMNV